MRIINLPVSEEALSSLVAGEQILLSGTVAAARDAAHNLMLTKGIIPFDIRQIPIFYMGPSPAPPGHVIGSCGPTTSARMEPFIPEMLKYGMRLVIGKGEMSQETRELFHKHKAVYLAAAGGAGALASTRIVSRKIVAWEHLGPEAVAVLELDR
ncbi:MAG: TRZ/ATZ family protein, partial [bacterium]|nr:TRZ/ATZ family protein [bacterium]